VGVDLDGDALEEQRSALGAAGVLHPVVADVSDPDAASAAVARAVELGGRVDVLANVAGGSRPGQDVVALDPAEWDRLVRVNLTSVYLMCRAVIPHMRASGGGSIVNVSSGAGLRGMHANPAYVAAKAGVVALTRALALDHGPEGIRTNCVAPGPVATPLMRRNRTPDEIAVIARQSIVGRLGEPEELAQVIAWLASDESSYVMGQTIAVDGGVASAI
jgi:NAD(P)-dependent dehydrogenase (short-subunit alcohol dehydrogenase family)